MTNPSVGAEAVRLEEDVQNQKDWKRWGPYLAERQWGTVREDYSPDGRAWDYFTHDHARSRAYRWGEDGLLGWCDRQARLCFSVALWNGKDPFLKERLFGVANEQGNHGEDVKECYYYLDSTPTHSYAKALYKYPQNAFPYQRLLEENKRRTRADPEFELEETGIFDQNEYFDVMAEYAKAAPEDTLIRLTVANRAAQAAELHLLPTLLFRNTWSWGRRYEEDEGGRPRLWSRQLHQVYAEHQTLGNFICSAQTPANGGSFELLFTENETNKQSLFGTENSVKFVKDGFHRHIVEGRSDVINPAQNGTKAAFHYRLNLAAGEETTVLLRLTKGPGPHGDPFGENFQQTFQQRQEEADRFYHDCAGPWPSADAAQIARQAYAGIFWSKQFYHIVLKDWQEGDPVYAAPDPGRVRVRNQEWTHLFARDVLSMPDKWEYPWFAAWDLAFHMVAIARIDPDFAKTQLLVLLREWYMRPNGQIPAYEWEFSDVNPPVHAWAAWRVYKINAHQTGKPDRGFLGRIFQKLLINFTWWVNRKDTEGHHLFSGGFLGLDNIGVFDRSKPLPTGGYLQQADGTAWMAIYALFMLPIALELAQEDEVYEDMASKFFEHFIEIIDAINNLGGTGLWDETDGFYYDRLLLDGQILPLKIRSIVGLIPLIAAGVLRGELIKPLKGFHRRLQWFLKNRPDLARHIEMKTVTQGGETTTDYLLAIGLKDRLQRLLPRLLDEKEFLSPFGIRSLSRFHADHPYIFHAGGDEHRVDYWPGESHSGLFGGNSNWRGPVWMPLNFLLIEALERYHFFYGDDWKVECPTGSGVMVSLKEVAAEISRRLCHLLTRNEAGQRPCHADHLAYAQDPHWQNLILFHEYFHAETGKGLGASHQTGWTSLVAELLRGLEL